VSVLNGAHLSPSGRLGNLVRKYHQSVSSAASTLTTTTASGEASNARNKEPSPPVAALVLSELGVSSLTEKQWKMAVDAVAWRGGMGGPFAWSVRDIVGECRSRGSLRFPHGWQSRRQFTSLAHRLGRARFAGWPLPSSLSDTPSDEPVPEGLPTKRSTVSVPLLPHWSRSHTL